MIYIKKLSASNTQTKKKFAPRNEVKDSKQKLPKAKNVSVLKLTPLEAKRFFLKTESYCNFQLPSYFVFDKLLANIDRQLDGKELSNFFNNDGTKPTDFDDLNHVIFNNKDGKYAWRPLELIHPILYVSLVHKITDPNHWTTICDHFTCCSKNPKIQCLSYPVESLRKQKDQAEQISQWCETVEQKSIELAIDYEYLIQTDISDCYGGIYTHSIAWALHGKEFAKKKENKENKKLIGNIIDSHLQAMAYGQTNGIPQGSALMDLIAEIVLAYTDCELLKKITRENSENIDYQILRYRDDYRIFVHNSKDGEKIVKFLTEIMIDLGLKLNPSKTLITDQIIRNSIKSDKLFWIGQKQEERNLQKHLLIIHNLATQFPNSGSLVSALNKYYKKIYPRKTIKESILPLISIIVDIAYRNPRTYAICSAILSKFFNFLNENEKRIIINKIKKHFAKIPNTGHLEIWLQRITITFDRTYPFTEPLCQMAADIPCKIWNMDWLAPNLSKQLQLIKIIDYKKIKELSPVIAKDEVELFLSKTEKY